MNTKTKGYIYLFNTIFFFSTYEVVSKTLVGSITPYQVNMFRFLIGGLVLFAALIYKRDISIGKEDFIKTVLIGIINVVISMNLIQLSLYAKGAFASVTAVIFSCNPIFVMIFSSIIEKEKIDKKNFIALFFGLIGTFVIFSDKISLDFSSILSPLFALLSAISFAIYTVIGKRVSKKIGSMKMNAYSFVSGSIILILLLFIFNQPVFSFDFEITYKLIYLSVFVTGIAYLTYFKGLSIIGAGKGSLVFFLKPVFASIIAAIFLKENISIQLVVGTILILFGIFFTLNKKTL